MIRKDLAQSERMRCRGVRRLQIFLLALVARVQRSATRVGRCRVSKPTPHYPHSPSKTGMNALMGFMRATNCASKEIYSVRLSATGR